MKLGVLFSGGKDSCLACHRAMQKNLIVCLISVLSKNDESYMFHTPNISLTELQAKAMGLPLVRKETEGRKEEELKDLVDAIEEAKMHGIEGIVTGAIDSVYQSTRIQRICNRLGLYCFNPLWQADQKALMEEVISSGFDAIVSGVFAYPLGREMLGRKIDSKLLDEMMENSKRYGISPSGEGGEIETFVRDGPMFRHRIRVDGARKVFDGDSGIYRIEKARLVKK
ncbi:MAG: TIGR00289 family protein [Candidatus Aenigmatarchaeota archaeon]|nr:MAG: TIGR00289 family protein [Candidatus Aenigmarchaeota archaeon]